MNAPTQVEKQVEKQLDTAVKTEVEAPAASTPRLEDFPYRLTDNVRFADLGPNQHVNSAVYATYFETGRVTLMKDRTTGLIPEGWPGSWSGSTFISHRVALAGTDRARPWRRQIGTNLGDIRSGRLFRGRMRRLGAGGDGSDR